MTNIIVVFPKIEDAKSIRNILVRNGFNVIAVCTTGSQVLNYADGMNDGLVVSGYRYKDMDCFTLREYLPKNFDVLMIASRQNCSMCSTDGIICVTMPLKMHELMQTVTMLDEQIMRRKRKRKEQAPKRSEEDKAVILEAKKLLMERNHMSDDEAHKYIQKCSMDSGTNMVEVAHMLLSIY